MVKVSIEVRSGAARFDVAVRAGSIQRAVGLIGERYPKGNVRVRFPIEPESFLAEDPSARTGIVSQELPARPAA